MAVRSGLQRQLPGRLVGRVPRRRRQPGVPARPADPRAAHPAGEGDQQHLHRAGAARRDGRHVRRLPRPRRPDRRSPPGCTATPPPRRRPGARRRRDRHRGTSSTRSPRPCPAGRTRSSRPPREPGSTCEVSTPTPSASPATRPPARTPSPRCSRPSASPRSDRRTVRWPLPSELRRTTPFLTHPVFHQHRSETAMLRYLRRLVRQGLRARPRHDPARLVHDEAQRHHRDGADQLAGVRRHPPVRTGRAGARATSS